VKDDIVHKEFHKEDLRYHTRQDKWNKIQDARTSYIENFLNGFTLIVKRKVDEKWVTYQDTFKKTVFEEGNHEIG
jgi:hypothetical protein